MFTSIRARRRRGLVAICISLLLFTLVPRLSRAASDFTYQTDITYRVDETGLTHVEELYTITNNVGNKYLDSIQLSTPTDEVKNLNVAYIDGNSVPSTTVKKTTNDQGYSYDYQEVDIRFTKRNVGLGLQWAFKIDYDTSKLVETKGSAHTVLIPSIAPNSQEDDYDVTLSVPQSFGTLHTTGAQPTAGGLDGAQALYKFGKDDLKKQAISVVFGDQTVYKVNFNFPLKNDSGLPKTFTVALPPDTSSQKIYINSLNPQPVATHLDVDGNVLADYAVPAHKEITVTTDVVGVVNYLEYDLSASGTKADIKPELVQRYTSGSHYWQTGDPDIVAAAKKATEGMTKVSDIVKALDDFVVSKLTYNNEKIKYNIRQGASKALSNPDNAVCLEYSDLLIALLRSQGIPARMPIGYGYSGNLKASASVADSLHSWVEAYVPGLGWMNVDPTWGEKYANYGTSDLDHFAFAIWGSNDSKPAAVTIGDADQGYQYEQTTLEYLKDAPEASTKATLSAEKWVILPFVSLVHYTVTAPRNVAGDNYYLKMNSGTANHDIQLGSLAPDQKVSSWVGAFGLSFSSALDMSLGQVTQTGNSVILSTTKIGANYLPLILIIALVAGILLILGVRWVIRRRRQHKLTDMRNRDTAPRSERDTGAVLREVSARTALKKDEDNHIDPPPQ